MLVFLSALKSIVDSRPVSQIESSDKGKPMVLLFWSSAPQFGAKRGHFLVTWIFDSTLNLRHRTEANKTNLAEITSPLIISFLFVSRSRITIKLFRRVEILPNVLHHASHTMLKQHFLSIKFYKWTQFQKMAKSCGFKSKREQIMAKVTIRV